MKETRRPALKIENEAFFEEVMRQLQEGKKVKIKVVGGSMAPFLKAGDGVLLQAADARDCKRGDIVLGGYQGKYVLHRLVAKREQEVVLAGDANYAQVENLSYEEVKAVAVQRFRDGQVHTLQKNWRRAVGLMWYKTRLWRRVYKGIKKK